MSDLSLRYLLFGEDRTASKAIKGVGGVAHSTANAIGGAFARIGSQVGGETGEMLSILGGGLSELGDHAGSMGKKLLAGGSALAGLGVALQLAGSKEQQATQQLDAAIDASGHSHEQYAEEIEKAIHAQENLGHGAADTDEALRKLTQASGDPTKALEHMSLVADLAAAKHMSLSDAAGVVAKIMSGKGGKALAEFGIALKKNKDGTVDVQGALDQLGQKLHGQASAAVDTFSGKLGVVKTKVGDWVAQMGQHLGPALTVAGPLIMGVGAIVESGGLKLAANTAKWIGNTAATIANTAAQLIAKGATIAWTGAQWLLNAALSANPIGLVIAGIVALVAVFVLAWTHSEKFRAIVTGAFHAVLGAVSAAFGWIRSHWPLLLAILTGPVGLAVAWIATHWSTVTGLFSKVVSGIKTVIGGVVDVITFPFRTAFNAVSDLWNGTLGRISFTIPSWIPGIGGKGFSFPHMPHLASGGIVTGPTVALLGEAGPEAVLPLSAGRGRGLGGGVTVNVTVQGHALGTPRQLAAAVKEAFDRDPALHTLRVRVA